MRTIVRALNKPVYIILVFTIMLSGVFPFIESATKAYALGEITTRSISISTSAPGAAATYTVKFTPFTTITNTAQAIVINFCDDSPIIAINCGWTSTSQSLNDTGTLGVTVTGSTDTTHWTIARGANNDSTNNGAVIVLEDSASDTFTAGTPITATITGLVNPNYVLATTVCAAVNQPNCTYYGRIITYSSVGTTVASDYTSPDPTDSGAINPVDAGGIALSTAAQIVITAKVQEQITFCVFDQLASGGAAGCGSANNSNAHEAAPSISLGAAPNGVLDATHDYTNSDINYQIQTNAGGGVIVYIYGDTLFNGGTSIAGITTAAPGALLSTHAIAQFGLCTAKVTTGSGVTFNIPTYTGGTNACASVTDGANGDGANDFFFDPSSSTVMGATNQLATVTPGLYSQGSIAFGANIPVTQEPGVYTANLGLVADGTY